MNKIQCSQCSKFKEPNAFYSQSGNRCKECKKIYQRTRTKMARKNAIDKANKWNKEHPERRKEIALNYYYRLQDAALLSYGGYKCACCGTTFRHFLTLDHINNDGGKHRKELYDKRIKLSGAGFYKWLRDNNYPSGFQVLCYNCNYGKHRNHGICPHQET